MINCEWVRVKYALYSKYIFVYSPLVSHESAGPLGTCGECFMRASTAAGSGCGRCRSSGAKDDPMWVCGWSIAGSGSFRAERWSAQWWRRTGLRVRVEYPY